MLSRDDAVLTAVTVSILLFYDVMMFTAVISFRNEPVSQPGHNSLCRWRGGSVVQPVVTISLGITGSPGTFILSSLWVTLLGSFTV